MQWRWDKRTGIIITIMPVFVRWQLAYSDYSGSVFIGTLNYTATNLHNGNIRPAGLQWSADFNYRIEAASLINVRFSSKRKRIKDTQKFPDKATLYFKQPQQNHYTHAEYY